MFVLYTTVVYRSSLNIFSRRAVCFYRLTKVLMETSSKKNFPPDIQTRHPKLTLQLINFPGDQPLMKPESVEDLKQVFIYYHGSKPTCSLSINETISKMCILHRLCKQFTVYLVLISIKYSKHNLHWLHIRVDYFNQGGHCDKKINK